MMLKSAVIHLSIILVLLLAGRSIGATIYAESCDAELLQQLIDSAQDGDTIVIPTCTEEWITWRSKYPAIYINQKSLTLQGSGIGNTVIKSNTNGGCTACIANEIPIVVRSIEGKPVRITGFTFTAATGAPTNATGMIQVMGTSKSVRVDHCHFDHPPGRGIFISGWVYGVVDHNIFDYTAQAMWVGHEAWGGYSNGDGSWADSLSLGTEKAVYIEDNAFTCTNPSAVVATVDAWSGARYVFRHNTVKDSYTINHGTESPGRLRSGFSVEVYNNTFTRTIDTSWWTALNFRGGTGVIFNNVLNGKYQQLASFGTFRTFHSFSPWGQCDGTSQYDVNDGVTYDTGSHSGSNSSIVLSVSGKSWISNQWAGYSLHNVTQNKASLITGNTQSTISYAKDDYAASMTFDTGDTYEILRATICIDQIGRGTGDLLSGYTTPTPQAWPNQVVAPFYIWDNTLNGSPINVFNQPQAIVENVNFYNSQNTNYTPYTYPHPLQLVGINKSKLTGSGNHKLTGTGQFKLQ